MDALDHEIRDMVDMANGRVYYRISSWYGVLRLMPFSGWFIRIWQQMLGVENPTVTATERRVPLCVKATLGFELLRCVLQTPKRMDALCDFYEDYAVELDRRLAAVLADERSRKRRACSPSTTACSTTSSRAGTSRSSTTCTHSSSPISPGKRSKAALADIRNLESMKPVRRMLALTEVAGADGMDSDAYRAAKDAFIRQYGDRCLGELKLETHTYRTHPALVDDFVRARLDAPTQLPQQEAPPAKSRDGFLVRRAKLGIRNRERSRMDRTRLFGTIRRIFRAVGEELFRQGRIDDPEDVFYLSVPELEAPSRRSARDRRAEESGIRHVRLPARVQPARL